MNKKIPAELLLPTIEELDKKTAKDLATKWKLRKRPGKREREAIKQKKYAEKLKSIAKEFNNQEQETGNSINNLSSLFVKNEKTKFSLNAMNGNYSANNTSRPTLKTALKSAKLIAAQINPVRKRGRPPKLNPI